MNPKVTSADRRYFIGGSDARIIMGDDEAALLRLWREKRGEVEPEDLSGNLIVQLGLGDRGAQSALVRGQYRPSHHGYPAADPASNGSVDGQPPSTAGSKATGAVFEAKFMLPWSFSEEAAAEKHMPQLQHNMWVVAARSAVLSVITGGGKWVEIKTHADPLYQHLIVTAERKFWRCVETGEPPRLFGRRTAEAAHRGGAHCRYELIQCLGGVRCDLCPHPTGLSRARKSQGRTEELGAGRRAAGGRAWRACAALEIRRHYLRASS